MAGVSSSKAELNLIIQQCPGLITCPKPEKKSDENSNTWKLKVEMTVTYNTQTYLIKKQSSDKNSKKAE
jgi:hypothetical protein